MFSREEGVAGLLTHGQCSLRPAALQLQGVQLWQGRVTVPPADLASCCSAPIVLYKRELPGGFNVESVLRTTVLNSDSDHRSEWSSNWY